MQEYIAAADRHSSAPVLLPEVAWRTYADRVRKFSAQYRKRVDDHVTATMRQWRAEVGPLAENDWLMFAVKLYDISTRQRATRNDWIDFDLARFLELLDVDSLLTWNVTVVERSE